MIYSRTWCKSLQRWPQYLQRKIPNKKYIYYKKYFQMISKCLENSSTKGVGDVRGDKAEENVTTGDLDPET